jgi:hypothetical protein
MYTIDNLHSAVLTLADKAFVSAEAQVYNNKHVQNIKPEIQRKVQL